jgi:thioredoxin reductase
MARSSNNNIDCEMLVIGGGPAGCSAAISAYSLGISVRIVEKHLLGGQVQEIEKIDNLLGGPYVGRKLASTFRSQIEKYNIPIVHAEATKIKRLKKLWKVSCDNSEIIRAEVIVAATGSRELRLAEHPLVSNVDKAHRDQYLYDVLFDDLMSKNTVVVGSDRVILTLVRSRGAKLKKRRITVLALPDKWYVIEDEIRSLPFNIIKVSEVLAVRVESSDETVIDYIDQNRTIKSIRSGLVLTNLGKVPNTSLFRGILEQGSDGYLVPKNYLNKANWDTAYAVGDVAHKAFQRISVAIGEGAYAALDYFYGRQRIYQSRSG